MAYDSEDEDEEMDLSPDEDELDLPENETSEDELDDLDDPRIEELATSDDEEIDAPKLVPSKSEPKKGKNKRAADATPEETPEKPTPDSILAKSLKPATDAKANGEQQPQLSKNQLKKQRKKMKDTAGNAVEVANLRQEDSTDKGVKASVAEISKTSPGGKPDKKVQFASTLVQGPSSGSNPSPDGARAQTTTAKLEGKKSTGDDAKPASGPRVVQGVTVDDRKTGTGQQAKKGNQVSMRYIGKLADTKRVFDCNPPHPKTHPFKPSQPKKETLTKPPHSEQKRRALHLQARRRRSHQRLGRRRERHGRRRRAAHHHPRGARLRGQGRGQGHPTERDARV